MRRKERGGFWKKRVRPHPVRSRLVGQPALSAAPMVVRNVATFEVAGGSAAGRGGLGFLLVFRAVGGI